MTSDAPVPSHQLRSSWEGAGISPTRRCAFGLAPLNSALDMPTTAIVDEPLFNRNCNNGARSLGRHVVGFGRGRLLEMRRFDAVIVGGGPSGAIAARDLARAGG